MGSIQTIRSTAKTVFFSAIGGYAACAAAQTAKFNFSSLDTSGFDVAQVRDVANGYAVGYGTIPTGDVQGSVVQHAFAWPLDGSKRIDISHDFRSEAVGVDNAGHIAGSVYFTSVMQSNPGYWSSVTSAPQNFTGNLGYSGAMGTQDHWLVGYGHNLGTPYVPDSAFVWDVNTKARTSLPGPGGALAPSAYNIDGNWVVGTAALGQNSNLGAAAWEISTLSSPRALKLHPAGFEYSSAVAVRAETAVGLARSAPIDQAQNHAYLWDLTTGQARDLHPLIPASMHAVASSANDVIGPIVVGSILTDSGALEPVMWNTGDGEVINLQQFMPAGATAATGVAINDKGQIVGDYRDAAGARGIFVLTPDVLLGDANFSGGVDLTDFTVLAKNFNRSNGDWGVADFNADGNVNLTDFTMLAANFNRTSAAGSIGSTVPEPMGLLPVLLAAASLHRRRRV
jgi:hypothetical protein